MTRRGLREQQAATRRRRARASAIMTTLVLAGSVALGLGAAGGTYALLNARTTAGASTVAAGSLDLLVNGSKTPTQLSDVSLVAGQSVAKPFTLTSTSTLASLVVAVDASVTVPGTPSALANDLRARVVALPNGTACDPSVTGGTSGPLVGYSAAGIGQLAAGESRDYCLVLSLIPGAPVTDAGQSVGFTLTMTARQLPAS